MSFGQKNRSTPARPAVRPVRTVPAVRPIGAGARVAATASATTQEEADDAAMSRHFTAAIIAVGVIACGGFFWAYGSSLFGGGAEAQMAHVSRLDRTCGEGWQKDQSNVDELHCYMTTQVSRLCDAAERKHLVATIERFTKDYAVYDARFNVAAMGTIVSVNANAVQLARADSRSRDPRLTEDQRNEALGQAVGIAGKALEGVEKVRSKKINSVKFYQLEDDLKTLITGGYVAAKDLDPSRANWIRRAIAGARTVNPSC
jgi:hypothetical protein